MRDHWVGKNVNLNLLSESIAVFLSKEIFKVKKLPLEQGYVIVGAVSEDGKPDTICRITGRTKDFTIEFLAGEKVRSSVRLGYILSLFIGGGLLLKSLEAKEKLERLEKAFWIFVDDEIRRQNGSAECSSLRN